MTIKAKKDKLPAGMSYVIKTSDIADAFTDADKGIAVYLRYNIGKPSNVVFRCEHLLPNPNVDHRRFHLTTYAKPSDQRKALNDAFKTYCMPHFAKWVAFVNSLPDNASRLKDGMSFNVNVEAGNLKIISDLEGI